MTSPALHAQTVLTLSLIFLLVLLAAPWRYWAVILYRPFTREFPRLSLKFALALTAYSLFVLLVALRAPRLLPFLAVLALAAVGWDLWRARPGYGRAQGWPPGSLAPMNLRVLFKQDYHRRQARRHGPIFKTCFFLKPVVCIVGLERGLALLRSAGTKLRPPRYPLNRFIPGGFLRSLSADRHGCYRDVFMDVFSADVVEANAPAFAATVRDALARAAARSAADTGRGIGLRSDFYAMVFNAWLQLFFGVRPDTAVAARLRELYWVIDVRYHRFQGGRRIAGAVQELLDFVRQQIAVTRGQLARGEAPPCFLTQLLKARSDFAEDPTVLGNLAFILHTSWGDISGFTQWLFKLLSDHAPWTDRLRAELDAGEPAKDLRGRDLMDRIILETFRLEQSELVMRCADEDVSVDGFVIPKGWLLRLCVWESHRDPAIFPEPDLFNPDRFQDREFTRGEFSPFGAGSYACLGPAVTMAFARVFLRELVSGYTWTVTSDGPPEYSAWCHWRPSSRFRVALAARH